MLKTILILSISYDVTIVNDFTTLINNIKEKYESLIIIVNDIKKSQFEHYKIINEIYHKKYNNYYILFSDDDDIWSIRRTLIYATLIKGTELANQNVDYIIYPYFSESTEYISNNIEVSRKIQNREIKIINGYNEYICICISFDIFDKFITTCDEKILKHTLCDRYFIKYLSNKKLIIGTLRIPLFGFSYHYWNNKYGAKNVRLWKIDDDKINDDKINDDINNFNYEYYMYLFFSTNDNKPFPFLQNMFTIAESFIELSRINELKYKNKLCKIDVKYKNKVCHKFIDLLPYYNYLLNSPIYKINTH